VIDSTGVLELVAFLQIKCGVRVLDEEILPENLDSISRIERYGIDKLGCRREAA
jgi:acyl carrier protein